MLRPLQDSVESEMIYKCNNVCKLQNTCLCADFASLEQVLGAKGRSMAWGLDYTLPASQRLEASSVSSATRRDKVAGAGL